MTLRRTLTAAILAASTVLPIGAVAVAAAPVAAAAEVPSCNSATYIPSRTEVLVVQWYKKFLNMNPNAACDNAGRFYWVDQINAGMPREEALGQIMRSDAYASNYVLGAYIGYLGRYPDSGAQYWVDGIKGGMAPEWVAQNVLASDEFAARSGSANNHVGDLYRSILGRGLLASWEADYWTNRMRQVGRLNVVRELWYSTEAIDRRTTEQYAGILGRYPSAGELAYWRPIEAASDIKTTAMFASTREYETTYEKWYQYGPDWK